MTRLVLCSLLGLVVLAGCGSDSGDDGAYLRELNSAQTAFATTATRIARTQQTGASLGENRRTLARYQSAIDEVVGDLRRIAAPTDVRREHGRLVAAMTSFRADVTSAIDALRDPTPSRVGRAQTTLRDALPALNSRLRAAAAAINTKLGVA